MFCHICLCFFRVRSVTRVCMITLITFIFSSHESHFIVDLSLLTQFCWHYSASCKWMRRRRWILADHNFHVLRHFIRRVCVCDLSLFDKEEWSCGWIALFTLPPPQHCLVCACFVTAMWSGRQPSNYVRLSVVKSLMLGNKIWEKATMLLKYFSSDALLVCLAKKKLLKQKIHQAEQQLTDHGLVALPHVWGSSIVWLTDRGRDLVVKQKSSPCSNDYQVINWFSHLSEDFSSCIHGLIQLNWYPQKGMRFGRRRVGRGG